MHTHSQPAATERVTERTDRELVAAILKGKRELLGELYRRYADRVYHKCLGIVKEQSLAQDMTHDVFIKVFSNLNRYQGKAELSYWIYAITYNHCISHLRAARRLRFAPIEEGREPTDHTEEALSEKLLQELRISQLEQLLRRLGREEEILLMMKYQEGMGIRQMATILELSESAVKMRLKRSRDNLGALLQAMQDE